MFPPIASAVVIVPPLATVRFPVTVAVRFDKLLYVRVPVTERLRRLFVLLVRDTLLPLGITTSSPFAGIPLGLQSPEVDQVRAPERDVFVAANADPALSITKLSSTTSNRLKRLVDVFIQPSNDYGTNSTVRMAYVCSTLMRG